jgi:nickel-type superoxide dismutase maturation protease
MEDRNGDGLARGRPPFESGLIVGVAVAGIALAIAPAWSRFVRGWELRGAVVGPSMEPLLRDGDWILVDPDAFRRRPPRSGDLVVVPDPRKSSRVLVKRVVRADPGGSLELAGDNPAASTDSRRFGRVDPGDVIGRPWVRYWPPGRIGLLRRR